MSIYIIHSIPLPVNLQHEFRADERNTRTFEGQAYRGGPPKQSTEINVSSPVPVPRDNVQGELASRLMVFCLIFIRYLNV